MPRLALPLAAIAAALVLAFQAPTQSPPPPKQPSAVAPTRPVGRHGVPFERRPRVAAKPRTIRAVAAPPDVAAVDPLMRAMEASPRVMVMEVGAILHSEVGETLLPCLDEHVQRDIETLKQRAGLDIFDMVDRMGVGHHVAVVSGHFADVRWERAGSGFEGRAYGDEAMVYTRIDLGPPFAVWRDQLVLLGKIDAIEAAIDRVEGRTAPLDTALPRPAGEMYGTVNVADLIEVLPLPSEVHGPLRSMLSDAGLGARVHAFVGDALRIRVEVDDASDDADAIRIVSEAVRAAVDAIKGGAAPADKREPFADILKGIRINDTEDGLSLEFEAEPDALRALFGACKSSES